MSVTITIRNFIALYTMTKNGKFSKFKMANMRGEVRHIENCDIATTPWKTSVICKIWHAETKWYRGITNKNKQKVV